MIYNYINMGIKDKINQRKKQKRYMKEIEEDLKTIETLNKPFDKLTKKERRDSELFIKMIKLARMNRDLVNRNDNEIDMF